MLSKKARSGSGTLCVIQQVVGLLPFVACSTSIMYQSKCTHVMNNFEYYKEKKTEFFRMLWHVIKG